MDEPSVEAVQFAVPLCAFRWVFRGVMIGLVANLATGALVQHFVRRNGGIGR